VLAGMCPSRSSDGRRHASLRLAGSSGGCGGFRGRLHPTPERRPGRRLAAIFLPRRVGSGCPREHERHQHDCARRSRTPRAPAASRHPWWCPGALVVPRRGARSSRGSAVRSVPSGREPVCAPDRFVWHHPEADELGELGDRLQRVAATGTKILGVIGGRRLAPDARATVHAPEVGHHVACAERVGAITPGGST
jgi:hypothetical protein